MPADFSDDQVAALLAQEAKDAAIKYSSMGLSAFMPAKPPIHKPKPNTRFLRNLVRETDSHNAALLAKEAADSKARLDQLVTKGARPEHDIRRRQLGNITAMLSANASGKTTSANRTKLERGPRNNSERADKHTRSGGQQRGESDRENRKERKDRAPGETDDYSRSRPRRTCDDETSRRKHTDRVPERDRARRSRSRSPARDKSGRSKQRERSPARHRRDDRNRHRDDEEPRRKHPEQSRTHSSPPGDHSDPLEEIVGPLPPPKVQARGRGTRQASSGIDTRFSESYDPSLDLSAGDGEDGDDWDMVLDRVKWRQQGADRLRAAGFTDKEVEGWESGRKPEVRWAKSGEGREWDRGKES